MHLFAVYNGYNGNGPVHVLVIAPTEERAKEMASERLKANARHDSLGRKVFKTEYGYRELYWTDLTAELLCENLSAEWAGAVED